MMEAGQRLVIVLPVAGHLDPEADAGQRAGRESGDLVDCDRVRLACLLLTGFGFVETCNDLQRGAFTMVCSGPAGQAVRSSYRNVALVHGRLEARSCGPPARA